MEDSAGKTELVFVYGSLKRGFGNNGVIANQQFVGEAVTEDSVWSMVSLGGFPGVINGNKKISGEVWSVNERGMRGLDALEGNGHFYTREVVNTDHGPAWMYVLPSEEFSGRDKTNVLVDDNGVETWAREYRA